eukprot:6473905-Amphidinium_carterae.4
MSASFHRMFGSLESNLEAGAAVEVGSAMCLCLAMKHMGGFIEPVEADWAFSLKTKKKRSTSKKLTKKEIEEGIEESAQIVNNLFDGCKALRPLIKDAGKKK